MSEDSLEDTPLDLWKGWTPEQIASLVDSLKYHKVGGSHGG